MFVIHLSPTVRELVPAFGGLFVAAWVWGLYFHEKYVARPKRRKAVEEGQARY